MRGDKMDNKRFFEQMTAVLDWKYNKPNKDYILSRIWLESLDLDDTIIELKKKFKSKPDPLELIAYLKKTKTPEKEGKCEWCHEMKRIGVPSFRYIHSEPDSLVFSRDMFVECPECVGTWELHEYLKKAREMWFVEFETGGHRKFIEAISTTRMPERLEELSKENFKIIDMREWSAYPAIYRHFVLCNWRYRLREWGIYDSDVHEQAVSEIEKRKQMLKNSELLKKLNLNKKEVA